MKHSAQSPDSDIILGIDPGTRVSGYGVISIQQQKIIPLDYGCIRPPPGYKLSERYLVIFDSIDELIEKYGPLPLWWKRNLCIKMCKAPSN